MACPACGAKSYWKSDYYRRYVCESCGEGKVVPEQLVGISAELYYRLVNWKFKTALQYITPDTPRHTKWLIEALSNTFGDCGWLPPSDLCYIVQRALHPIIGYPAEEDEDYI